MTPKIQAYTQTHANVSAKPNEVKVPHAYVEHVDRDWIEENTTNTKENQLWGITTHKRM